MNDARSSLADIDDFARRLPVGATEFRKLLAIYIQSTKDQYGTLQTLIQRLRRQEPFHDTAMAARETSAIDGMKQSVYKDLLDQADM